MPLHPLSQGWVGCLSRQAKPSRIFNLFGQGSLPGQIERLPGLKGRSETGRIPLPTPRGILGAHKIASSTETERSAKGYTEAARDDK